MDKKDREELENESPFTTENREEKNLVSLGGTAITSSGKLTRSNFFRFIGHNLDDYDDMKLSKEEATKIHHHLQKLSTGSAAMIPMYCGGEHQCPFADRCPLVEIGQAPIFKQCLLEVQLMKEWIIRYFNEYDVDPNSFTEVAYVSELAEIEIMLMRLNMNLAKPENADLVIDQVTAIGQDGTPILQKQISPFMDQKEKLQSRKSRIIKLMVGDRQEKYKKEAALKMKIDQDPSSKQAAMRNKLDALGREMESLIESAQGREATQKGAVSPQDIIDAEFEED
jgi:hypothetical protein